MENTIQNAAVQSAEQIAVINTAEQNAPVSSVVKTAPDATAENAKKSKKVKIKFLLSPCGVFQLPYNVGQEVSLPEAQATEIVEARYAEFVK